MLLRREGTYLITRFLSRHGWILTLASLQMRDTSLVEGNISFDSPKPLSPAPRKERMDAAGVYEMVQLKPLVEKDGDEPQ